MDVTHLNAKASLLKTAKKSGLYDLPSWQACFSTEASATNALCSCIPTDKILTCHSVSWEWLLPQGTSELAVTRGWFAPIPWNGWQFLLPPPTPLLLIEDTKHMLTILQFQNLLELLWHNPAVAYSTQQMKYLRLLSYKEPRAWQLEEPSNSDQQVCLEAQTGKWLFNDMSSSLRVGVC